SVSPSALETSPLSHSKTLHPTARSTFLSPKSSTKFHRSKSAAVITSSKVFTRETRLRLSLTCSEHLLSRSREFTAPPLVFVEYILTLNTVTLVPRSSARARSQRLSKCTPKPLPTADSACLQAKRERMRLPALRIVTAAILKSVV